MHKKQYVTTLIGAALLAAALGCGRDDATSMSAEEREVAQRIRQTLVADESLSPSAKNVAIVADDDSVTLRGSVANEQERSTVAAKAKQAAPDKTIENELVVASR